MSKYISKKLDNLTAYTPGEQPKQGEFIKLNTNESPYPPPPTCANALMDEVFSLNLYNDNNCTKLTEAFAESYDVSTENVIFSNGSDEMLAFCFYGFCDDTVPAVFPEISYGFYKVYSQLFNINPDKIPLADDLSINYKDYLNKNATIVIANPNAPTGLALSLTEIEEIVTSNKNNVVIIDEAYVDFGGDSAIPLTKKYDNLIVVGTFSKSRNLAGARLGYAVANKELIVDLNKIKYSFNPYNVNALTQTLGLQSILQDDYFNNCVKKIVTVRDKFTKELEDLGFNTIPSKANFIFTKHSKISGENLYLELRKAGVLVRYFDDPKINDYIRITIGKAAEMDEVLNKIKVILEV